MSVAGIFHISQSGPLQDRMQKMQVSLVPTEKCKWGSEESLSAENANHSENADSKTLNAKIQMLGLKMFGLTCGPFAKCAAAFGACKPFPQSSIESCGLC